MRVAVLGSSGYLGCRLTRKLAENGFEVFCLKLKEDEAPGLRDIKGKAEIIDLEDYDKVDHVDCLVNLCCRYQRGGVSDKDVLEANLFTPLRFFLDSLDKGMKRFITIDTSLPENVNLYSMSKKSFSRILYWYAEKGIEAQIVNVQLENFYGENEPKDRFIPSTILRLKRNEEIRLTAGDQKRDWIYAGDVIDAIYKLIGEEELPAYTDLPLGTGESVAVRTVIEYLKQITGSSSELLFGAIEKREHEPDTCADTKKMKELGIETKYNWQKGLKKLI